LADRVEHRLRLLEQLGAGRREAHAARMALKQLHAHLRLELRDRARERRLREVELLGRARDLALFRSDDEIAQLTQPERRRDQWLAWRHDRYVLKRTAFGSSRR